MLFRSTDIDAQYYTVPEIEAAIDAMVTAYPTLARKVDLSALPGGQLTIGGRHIYALKVSDNVAVDEDEPAILLAAATATGWLAPPGSRFEPLVKLVSDPDLVMIATLAVAAVTLGLSRGRSVGDVMGTFTSAINDVASILLMIGGSGAFKQVLVQTGVDRSIASALGTLPIDPLVLGWAVTAAIRVCVGSATVAGLTAAGLLAPLVEAGGVDLELMVLSIGAGSLALSHVNDGAFWMFKEYFRVGLVDTLKTWTVMETIVSVTGLVGVLVLARVL